MRQSDLNVLPSLSDRNFLVVQLDIPHNAGDLLWHYQNFVVEFYKPTFNLPANDVSGYRAMWEDVRVRDRNAER